MAGDPPQRRPGTLEEEEGGHAGRKAGLGPRGSSSLTQRPQGGRGVSARTPPQTSPTHTGPLSCVSELGPPLQTRS